jgi:hypothetical protein
MPGGVSILTTDKQNRQVLYDKIKKVEDYLVKAFESNKIVSAWIIDGRGNNIEVFAKDFLEDGKYAI